MPTPSARPVAAAPRFYEKNKLTIWLYCYSLAAVAAFLTVSFCLFDATQMDGPNRSIRQVDRKAKAQELIADKTTNCLATSGSLQRIG